MKALIAMSGGVDSSVAAFLMRERGCDCIGCTMKLYTNEDVGISRNHTCCSVEDIEDARSVAYKLGMSYYVFNFTEDFREKVIKKFVQCYVSGLTPNPCIDCNRYIKFEKLYERARLLGCDYVVTGHYARIEKDGNRYLLKKAMDESKDQSYVLYDMTQEQLAHTLFPLGMLRKAETRRIADENGFVNADKPDSQDICFVPNGDYANVIENYMGEKAIPGDFICAEGSVLGKHKGIIHYTIGQRRGLGISNDEPLYVCNISSEDNTVTLGTKEELFSQEVTANEFHWISGERPKEEIRCKAKMRYRQVEHSVVVIPINNDVVHIIFNEPQRAVTPGQAVVLYDGDIVLGGGVIMPSKH